MFNDKFDSGVPVYLQIIQLIRQKIVSGEWAPGSRIPGVRDLAIEFGVNPNTMQKALSELEREGLLYSERTAGRFITDSTEIIDAARERLAGQVLEEFIRQMVQMGFTREKTIKLVESAFENRAGLNEKEENS